MRPSSATDFSIQVDAVGEFIFGRRTFRDQFRIQAEYARLTEGVEPVPSDLSLVATAVAALTVLTVKAPDGWDIEKLDPLEEDTYAKVLLVFGALRAREERFRGRAKEGSEGRGQGGVEKPLVLVPPEVQPAAD